MFHCEDQALLDHHRQALLRVGRTGVADYATSKPYAVETSATGSVLNWTAATGVPTYVVHLSSREALELTRAARAAGLPVFVETRPLYLHLTEDVYPQPDAAAALFVSTPPLRVASDVEALWTALQTGDVQVIGSDHIGYAARDKYRPGDSFDDVPKGVANLEKWVGML